MTYKQEILKALRSGEYKQGKGRLQSDKGFCCLGVMCKAMEKQGVQLEYLVENPKVIAGYAINELQPNVGAILRPRSPQGTLPFMDRENSPVTLTRCNDFYEMPFNQIADLVEFFWEDLFNDEG